MKVEFNEMKETNKIVMICYIALVIILELAYLADVLTGDMSWGYYVAFCIIASTPSSINYALFRRDMLLDKLGYITFVGTTLFYTFIMSTTDTFATSLYIIPFMCILTLYRQKTLIRMMAIIEPLIFIASLVYNLKIGNELDMTENVIFVAAIILTGIYLVIITKFNYTVFNHHIEAVEESKKTTENLLNHATMTRTVVSEKVEESKEMITNLNASMCTMKTSMNDLDRGVETVVCSIKDQLDETAGIENLTHDVSKSVSSIDESVKTTLEVIGLGLERVQQLISGTEASKQMSDDINKKLVSINQVIQDVSGIVNNIQTISNQTKLLSLNAQIEAARAGEHGTGFAVVASEIGKLSEETQESSNSISHIVETVVHEVKSLVLVITELIEKTENQKQLTEQVSEAMKNIFDESGCVETATVELNHKVDGLLTLNTSMNNSIQAVSEVTRDLLGLSNSTAEICVSNTADLTSVESIVNDINDALCEES